MGQSHRQHGPEVERRVKDLLKLGTSVALICERMHVSKSFVKRARQKLNAERTGRSDED